MKTKTPIFRASECHNLTGRARRKEPDLTDAGKKYVRGVWLREQLDFNPPIDTKYMKKGRAVEPESLNKFANKYLDSPIFKNPERRTVGHLTGEPDAVTKEMVIDVKSSWSAETFINADLSKQYEFQVRAYMELFERDRGLLVYVLNDMPDDLLMDETRRFCWQHRHHRPGHGRKHGKDRRISIELYLFQ